MNDDSKFPAGKCECNGCPVHSGDAPAAYSVVRDGKQLKVCTRCDLSTDSDKTLLLGEDTPMEPFWNFDALGAFCIVGRAVKDRDAKAVA